MPENIKISELTELSQPEGADILPIVDDLSGAPITKKITVTKLMSLAPVQSVAGKTGDVTLTVADVSGLGTASSKNVGTAQGDVVQLDATGLPAVDGSQLTNISTVDSTKLAIANNLSDLNDKGTARTNLGVDAAGTDNSTDVTLTGTPDYITINGQEITVSQIDLANDVTGSLPSSSVSGLGTAATTDSSDYATATHTHAIDDLSDVTITSAQNEDVIKFNGTSFVNGQVSVDVDTPINASLTLALRGTDNPHIGAYPNLSLIHI